MNINASLFLQALVFAVLVLVTWKFIWPPLMATLDERAKRIADGLSAADRAKHDLELAEKRAAEELRKAKSQASEIIAQAEKRASAIVEEAKDAARVEGDRLIAGAKAEVDQQVHQAKEELRQHVSALALAGAEKILRKEVDAARHADLLATLKAEL
ncbi:F0F1 ATP synthase subunit B [Chitinimonas taiwanensis]|jgi:F-type H+-transporting ATPase subunit b|uniref:ATP synthase subunit b n=1 Tax=Chitinimonas taiwanensis DSM 18899 TaxID=1121279 RepID=A0A1K2HQN3_9NEIS|nr:F0F1 ATP synthase subunit B [Chitinimonas taiwanensis]SFZ78562.1 F-type H+-transporting ATPase subunit b [Chitinimonas taiwanensis DSM 18899]